MSSKFYDIAIDLYTPGQNLAKFRKAPRARSAVLRRDPA